MGLTPTRPRYSLMRPTQSSRARVLGSLLVDGAAGAGVNTVGAAAGGAGACGAGCPWAAGRHACPNHVTEHTAPGLHSLPLVHPPQRPLRQRANGHCGSLSLPQKKPSAAGIGGDAGAGPGGTAPGGAGTGTICVTTGCGYAARSSSRFLHVARASSARALASNTDCLVIAG